MGPSAVVLGSLLHDCYMVEDSASGPQARADAATVNLSWRGALIEAHPGQQPGEGIATWRIKLAAAVACGLNAGQFCTCSVTFKLNV